MFAFAGLFRANEMEFLNEIYDTRYEVSRKEMPHFVLLNHYM